MSTTQQDNKAQKAPELPNQHTQVNTIRWLLEKLDDIHSHLCPGQIGIGTWRQRAEQAVEAAKRLAANSDDLSEKLRADQIKADARWMLDQIKARQP